MITNSELMLASLVVFLLVLLMILLFRTRKRSGKKTLELFSRLPLCLFVVNQAGKILYLHDPGKKISDQVACINDFPEEIRSLFKNTVEELFQKGEEKEIEYHIGTEYRKAHFVLLPEELFREKTVMWLSRDTTLEYLRQNELKIQHKLLHFSAEMSNLVSFRTDKEGTLMDGLFLEKFWTFHDGKPAKPEDVICKEDLPAFISAWQRLLNHEIDEFSLSYSSELNGNLCYFTTRVCRMFNDFEQKEEIFGVAQDVTELRKQEFRNLELLEEERFLSSNLELLAGNPERDSLSDLLKKIGMELNASSAHVYRLDFAAKRQIAISNWWHDGPKKEYETLRLNPENLWVQQLRRHELILIPDIRNEKPIDEIILLKERKTLSLISAGIWIKNELRYSFSLGFSVPKNNLEKMTKNMRTLAHLLELALENMENRTKREQSEYENRLILDSIDIPTTLFDRNMRLIYANKAASHLAGRDQLERIHESRCNELFCHLSSVPSYCPVRKTMLDEKPHMSELALKNRFYHIHSNPIFINGELTYILKTDLDFTEAHETRRKLVATIESSLESERSKELFLTKLCNEIRLPLDGIVEFGEQLQKKDLKPEERDVAFGRIALARISLMNLLNGAMTLYRIESDSNPISQEAFSPADFIAELSGIFQQTANNKKIDFIVHTQDAIPVIMTDFVRLRGILLNLIENAFKFTDRGQIVVSVLFEKTNPLNSLGRLTILVADTGSGISPEVLGHLFEPFPHHGVHGHRPYDGIGLEMAIAQRTIAKMGGRIDVKTELGAGTTFTIVLESVAYIHSENEMQEKSMRTVLVVDDIPSNLKLIGAMLQNMGLSYIGCSSAEEALNEIAKKHPALILTDLWMPGMNGDDMVHQLEMNPLYAEIPVIAVTADLQCEEHCRELFNAVLFKPVTKDRLEKTIRNIVPELFETV